MASLAALAAFVVHAAGGFATLSSAGADNDSLLRLVEIRDLMAGQGWFDLHQYRMGLDGGFVMHWSRLVDAPIAAIILAGSTLTNSQAAGETAALIIWPLALFAVALFCLLRASRVLSGEAATFPALAVGSVSLFSIGIFSPGAIDHHNVQLVLTLAALALLLEASAGNRKGFGAGACAALMLAVGMETAPYVAVAGLCVALWFLFRGEEAARPAIGFGLAFALVSAMVLVATVPAGTWLAVQCDAFSLPQFTLACLGGLGLAAIALPRAIQKTGGRRLAALACLGVVVAIAANALFPQCLGDPFAGIEPRLKTYWLGSVIEAQPLWSIVATDPAMAPGFYATALIGLVLMALRLRSGICRADAFVGAFLLAAFVVSIWQVRGSMFSIPLAVLPLAGWVAMWRARAKSSPAATVKMVLAWLASFSIAWTAAAHGASRLLRPEPAQTVLAGPAACENVVDYARLATLPATKVLAISNLGAPILRHTEHRVLAGPYHRNVAGNLTALSAFMGSTEEAHAIVVAQGVTMVALCPGNSESTALAGWAPDGFMASLLAGNVPDWLEALPDSDDQPLRLFRVTTAN